MDLLKPLKALRLAWMILSKETPVAERPKSIVQSLYNQYDRGEIDYYTYFKELEREGFYEPITSK